MATKFPTMMTERDYVNFIRYNLSAFKTKHTHQIAWLVKYTGRTRKAAQNLIKRIEDGQLVGLSAINDVLQSHKLCIGIRANVKNMPITVPILSPKDFDRYLEIMLVPLHPPGSITHSRIRIYRGKSTKPNVYERWTGIHSKPIFQLVEGANMQMTIRRSP